MRHCENETVEVYEAVGDNIPELLRDAADTLEGIEDYTWADLKVECHFGDNDYDGSFVLSMNVHT